MSRRKLGAIILGGCMLGIGAAIGPGSVIIRELAGMGLDEVIAVGATPLARPPQQPGGATVQPSTLPSVSQPTTGASPGAASSRPVVSASSQGEAPTRAPRGPASAVPTASSALPTQAPAPVASGGAPSCSVPVVPVPSGRRPSPAPTASVTSSVAPPPAPATSAPSGNISVVSFDCLIMSGSSIYVGADFLGEGTIKLYVNDRLVASKVSTNQWGGSISSRTVGSAGTCTLVTSRGVKLTKTAW